MPHSQLPSVFAPGFQDKLDSALAISAETSTGGTYLVAEAFRVDFKDQSNDQEPFCLIVRPVGEASEGVFLHHGDWKGRSVSPPEGFWEEIEVSGVGDYFFSRPPPGRLEGSLQELPPGYLGAFNSAVREIRSRTDQA